jgi:chitinase
LLSIGGWDLNTNDDTKAYFSTVAANDTFTATFAQSAVAYARKYDFDGISVDWFFPAFVTQGGTSADKANFVKLITAVRESIDADAASSGDTALLLSITVSGNLDVADAGYDVPSLAPLVDIINVMTYDYAGDWTTSTQVHTDFPSAKDSLDFYLVQGAPKEKLLMSVATFGRSFTVSDADTNDAVVDIPVSGIGNALTASNTAGLVAYYEIVTMKQDSSSKSGSDGVSGGSILAYNSDQWVAYDDVDQVKVKAQYVVDNDFGGVMVWSVDLDDFANGFPLTSAVASTLGIEAGSGSDSDAALSASVTFVSVIIAVFGFCLSLL